MQHNQGTRLVAAATLALGLTFSLSACDAGSYGQAPIAAENTKAGVTVREDQVQEATAGWKKLLVANGTDAGQFDPGQAMYALSLEPILADGAEKLQVGVSMDDARTALKEKMAAITSNRKDAELPELTDGVVRLFRFGLLKQAISGAQQHKDFQKVVLEMNDKVTKGWTFGQRYGGFSVGQNGTEVLSPSRPWLGKYVPLPASDSPATDGGMNGRPIDNAKSGSGDYKDND